MTSQLSDTRARVRPPPKPRSGFRGASRARDVGPIRALPRHPQLPPLLQSRRGARRGGFGSRGNSGARIVRRAEGRPGRARMPSWGPQRLPAQARNIQDRHMVRQAPLDGPGAVRAQGLGQRRERHNRVRIVRRAGHAEDPGEGHARGSREDRGEGVLDHGLEAQARVRLERRDVPDIPRQVPARHRRGAQDGV